MKTISYWIFIATALITLYSCEGETSYSKSDYNHTDDTLTFVIFSSYPGLIKDSFEIFPNQEKDFWYWSKLGGSNTDAPCNEGIDSIHFYASDSVTLQKDFLDNHNWDYSRQSNKRGSMVDNYCTFHVRAEDLGK